MSCEHCMKEAERRASKAAGTVDEHYAAIVDGRTLTSTKLDHAPTPKADAMVVSMAEQDDQAAKRARSYLLAKQRGQVKA
ncbi:hypothetical protein [Rhodococcus sp. 14-2470-1a]|uniref:hypothetical protein n=1 Tax=Rhodococcus sp. 14-2470-1a TaxID=2023150 RepID=UPI000B9BC567|nr:hypothetical protein [Rhodococcus sp. 14-2470-1a]OZF41900.1 hypothetical protein CH292_27220 [Rhodococcus sp. 14-2470-1a]